MKLSPYEKRVIIGLLRQLLDARDGPKCLRCRSPDRQMSHIYPKGTYRRLEFDPDNLKWLCHDCHIGWWHQNPTAAKQWLHTVVTKERIDRLKREANTSTPVGMNYAKHKTFLESELKKLIKK